jgi:hypothetical protein
MVLTNLNWDRRSMMNQGQVALDLGVHDMGHGVRRSSLGWGPELAGWMSCLGLNRSVS